MVVTQEAFQTDLGVTEKEYSWVTACFQVGLLLQPIAGYVMDVIGLKLGFGLFALAWALLTGPRWGFAAGVAQ